MPHLTVVAPMFNEQGCVVAFCDRVVAVLEDLTSDWTVILIDDHSTDETWALIEEVARVEPRICGYRLDVNHGQFTAIRAGLERCDADWVVVMDGDLQELPEAIPVLYQQAQHGHELVLARKRLRRQPLARRVLAVAYFRTLNVLSRLRHEPGVGNFRLLSRANVDWILAHGVNSWLFGLTGDPARSTAIVDVDHAPRFAGATSYRWSRRINMALEGIACGWFGAPVVSDLPRQHHVIAKTDPN